MVVHLSATNGSKSPSTTRSKEGFSLVETMVSVIVGGIIMTAVFGDIAAMYRASAGGQNQILASNMAQQVIDNARNSSWPKLTGFLNGGATASQQIPLYQYPVNPAASMFPRPLLMNQDVTSGLTYSQQAQSSIFNGTVTETITNMTPGQASNGTLRVTVNIAWTDTRGSHTYTTSTVISQTGIHS